MKKIIQKKDEIIIECNIIYIFIIIDFSLSFISLLTSCSLGTRNNELKTLEISKMEELFEKFKALLAHMKEEKEILTSENDRL